MVCVTHGVAFHIHGSVHRNSILKTSNKMQQYAGIYLLQNPNLPPMWPDLATLEEGCCSDTMTCTRVLPTVVRRCVWSRNLVKMRSHTQSVVTEPNRRRITGSISYKPLISDLSVLRVCNKTGGTIKGYIKKKLGLYKENNYLSKQH